MTVSVYDLHCDLLDYLQQDLQHSPLDQRARCGLPHLLEGGVRFQVLALFVEGGIDSVCSAERQVEAYRSMRRTFRDRFSALNTRLSIENASALCTDEEPVQRGIERLDCWTQEFGPFAYVSLTWNGENRFGGGAHTQVGLRDDGKRLLHAMAERAIPLDLAHASDRLAEESLQYLEVCQLSLPLLYSHGALRAVKSVPRNLPDWLLEELVRRRGLIGLCLVRPFIGDSPRQLCDHVSYALEKGAGDLLCFGADFFVESSIPASHRSVEPYFFEEWNDASCYPNVLDLLRKELGLSEEMIAAIAYRNIENQIS